MPFVLLSILPLLRIAIGVDCDVAVVRVLVGWIPIEAWEKEAWLSRFQESYYWTVVLLSLMLFVVVVVQVPREKHVLSTQN